MSINVEWETFKIKFGHFTKIRIAANWCTMFLFFFYFFFLCGTWISKLYWEKPWKNVRDTKACSLLCDFDQNSLCFSHLTWYNCRGIYSIFFVVVVIVVEHTMCDRRGTDERQQKMFSWFWYSVFLKRSTL